MINSKYTWILDNGHGIDTKGKRTPTKIGQLYEYEFNRDIVNRVHTFLQQGGIHSVVLVPEIYDVSRSERIARINRIYAAHPNTLGISVHANGGGGTGVEFYSDKSMSFSDIMADAAVEEFKPLGMSNRGHKERNFDILRQSACPFILGETGFMDTLDDYNNLIDPRWRSEVAACYVSLIYNIEER